jgi:hypothetical protein
MRRTHALTVLALCSAAVHGLGGSITYRVTLNPDTCQEVHLPRLTKPDEVQFTDNVNTGYFHLEIRSAGETEIYLTAAAGGGRDPLWFARERYAVDLSRPKSVRRIDEQAWQSSPLLPRSEKGLYPQRADQRGVQYKGPVLERSGPTWKGSGVGPLPETSLSWNMNRAAVNSWDGYDIVYTFLDPTSFGKRSRIHGRYWVDIYETASGKPLVRIQGSFSGAEPGNFQRPAAWFGDRYYVIPLGGILSGARVGLQRLLICDVDAAARKDKTVLKERK